MNVQRIPVRGTSQTVGNTAKRAIVVPLLPMDGAFSISGTILAVDDSATRFSVEFYPRFGGSVVAGKVTENSTGAPAAQPQDGGTGQGWAPGAPKATITGRQLEVTLTGIDGKTIDWAWDLEVILFSLPAGTAGTAATKQAPGSSASAASKASAGSTAGQ
jgi:hypothetical protein